MAHRLCWNKYMSGGKYDAEGYYFCLQRVDKDYDDELTDCEDSYGYNVHPWPYP